MIRTFGYLELGSTIISAIFWAPVIFIINQIQKLLFPFFTGQNKKSIKQRLEVITTPLNKKKMLNSFIIQKSIIGNPRLSSGEILTRPNESKELFNLYLLLTYIYIYIYIVNGEKGL